MKIEVREVLSPEGIFIVRISGVAFGWESVSTFDETLNNIVKKEPLIGLVLDFTSLSVAFDGAIINIMLGAHKKLTKQGKKMAIATQNRVLKNFFAIIGIDRIIPIYDSEVMAVVGIQS